MSDAFLPGNGFDTYETQDKVLVSMDGSVDCGLTGLLELAQRLDKGRQLHAVVGGAGVAAAQFLFVHLAVKAVAQHRTPAARAGIAAASAVCVHLYLFHGVLLME